MIALTPTLASGGPARQEVTRFGAQTAKVLKDSFGDAAILSFKDKRMAAAFAAAKNMGSGISAKDLGPGWQYQMTMIPGSSAFELSSHGPRATRQLLSIDGESQTVTLTATYPNGSKRVFDTIKGSSAQQATHTFKNETDHQG